MNQHPQNSPTMPATLFYISVNGIVLTIVEYSRYGALCEALRLATMLGMTITPDSIKVIA